jgi:hypothetical protein
MKSSFILSGTALALVSLSVACGGSVDPTGQTESTLGSTTSGDDGVSSTPKRPSTALICKGGLPDICEVCADGKSECAHWVVVHGKCEVEICGDPSTTPPPPPVSTPPICKGPLPDTCEVCADGATGCAHWEVVHGKCEVEFCPGPSTGPTPEPTPVSTGPVPAG